MKKIETIETCPFVKDFLLWRDHLFQCLKARKETIIELLDALSSNQQAPRRS